MRLDLFAGADFHLHGVADGATAAFDQGHGDRMAEGGRHAAAGDLAFDSIANERPPCPGAGALALKGEADELTRRTLLLDLFKRVLADE